MPVVRPVRSSLAFWLPAALLCASQAHAESSNSADVTDQILQSSTDLYVDVLTVGERIRWQGQGNVIVYRPNGTQAATLSNNQSHTTNMTGAWRLDVQSEQRTGGGSPQPVAWDVTVFAPSPDTTAYTGRLHSYSWEFYSRSFAQDREWDGSFYALVRGGLAGYDGVIEFKADGWSGNEWELQSNSVGVDGANGRSVPESGNSFDLEYPIYMNPPAKATYQTAQPEIVGQLYGKALGRKPAPSEQKLAEQTVGNPVQKEGVEDLLWAMIMLPEFQLIY